MTQPDATPSAPRGPQDPDITAAKNPVAAHPVTSAVIGLLVAAAICGTLIVPIYARITPKIGDFPFFYFYLLAYMPARGDRALARHPAAAQAAGADGTRAAATRR